MKAAYNSDRAFGGLLSAGLSFDLVCQAMVNMGVVVGLGPITGQPLAADFDGRNIDGIYGSGGGNYFECESW